MSSSDGENDAALAESPNVKVVAFGSETARKSLSVVVKDGRVSCFRAQWVRLWGLNKDRFGRDPDAVSDFGAHGETATKEMCQQQRGLNPGSTDTKMTIVDVDCLARHTPACNDDTVAEIKAFAVWAGPCPIVRKPHVSDDPTGDDDDDDDDDDADGHSRRFGLTTRQREEGIVGVHYRALRSFYRSPIDLGRGTRSQLSQVSVRNAEQVLSVFMGFEQKTLAGTLQIGALSVLDGDRIWRFYKHLLEVRGLKLSSVEQYANWLLAAVDFVLIDVLQQADDPWAKTYRGRIHNFVLDLRRWGKRCGHTRPTFRELVDKKDFVFLPEILKRTAPFIERAMTRFRRGPSVRTAGAVRNAALLSFVAGDSFNVRPGEVAFLSDAERSGRCLLGEGCGRPRCPGNTARILDGGAVELCITHHKTMAETGKARLRTLGPETLTARVLVCLIREAAPFLRRGSATAGIIVKENGEPITDSRAVANYITGALSSAGELYFKLHPEDGENHLDKLTARDCRRATAVHVTTLHEEHPELFPRGILDLEEVAEAMGHSWRQWGRYDVYRQARAATNEQRLAATILGPLLGRGQTGAAEASLAPSPTIVATAAAARTAAPRPTGIATAVAVEVTKSSAAEAPRSEAAVLQGASRDERGAEAVAVVDRATLAPAAAVTSPAIVEATGATAMVMVADESAPRPGPQAAAREAIRALTVLAGALAAAAESAMLVKVLGVAADLSKFAGSIEDKAPAAPAGNTQRSTTHWVLKPGAQLISMDDFDRMKGDRALKRERFLEMYDGGGGQGLTDDSISSPWFKAKLTGIKRNRG